MSLTLQDLEWLDGWQLWQGVTGLWYTRRIMSSPPWVMRDEDLGRLRERIVNGEPPPWHDRNSA
jgi:hypothetical protein